LKIVGALKGSVEIANGAGGAVPSRTALSYLKFAHGLPSGHFFRAKLEGLTGYDTLNAPESSIQDAVNQFMHPDVEAGERANAVALGIRKKPKVSQLRPSQITTLVLNGTTIPGLARDTSYKLAVRGYHTFELDGQQPANAPSQSYFPTNVYFDPAQANSHRAARQLQTLFKSSIVSPMPAEITPFARDAGNPLTIVVLGSSFDGTVSAETAALVTIPKHAPPDVTSSPGTTLQPLREARKRLPFRLAVPHVLEKRSYLARETPFRIYKPAPHHKALRMTFVTGPGNVYWGIEETDWNDAPVLAHPTVTHTFAGRRFDFYYAGSHLHMVVLRDGAASYWVVNTLLDELSNETMIAIARGLKPLAK
jgi:LytR cell envelope-related transcriptional attenuator